MRVGRWRRWRWRGGGAKEKRRIGEEETSVLILASSRLLSARKAVKF